MWERERGGGEGRVRDEAALTDETSRRYLVGTTMVSAATRRFNQESDSRRLPSSFLSLPHLAPTSLPTPLQLTDLLYTTSKPSPTPYLHPRLPPSSPDSLISILISAPSPRLLATRTATGETADQCHALSAPLDSRSLSPPAGPPQNLPPSHRRHHLPSLPSLSPSSSQP